MNSFRTEIACKIWICIFLFIESRKAFVCAIPSNSLLRLVPPKLCNLSCKQIPLYQLYRTMVEIPLMDLPLQSDSVTCLFKTLPQLLFLSAKAKTELRTKPVWSAVVIPSDLQCSLTLARRPKSPAAPGVTIPEGCAAWRCCCGCGAALPRRLAF